MYIQKALRHLFHKENLDEKTVERVAEEMIHGKATEAQIGAFLMGLAMKGETVDEILGMVRVMRSVVITVNFDYPVVDTCGTGGDMKNTFNISTAVAFVVAGCGVPVAKHGNRSVSSTSGSADVLECLGARIQLDAEAVRRCVDEVGVGFFFAPRFHPAMKYVMQPRKDIAVRTIFNYLGPLLSPAGVKHQVIGLPQREIAEKLIQVVGQLDSEHVLIVVGEDGLDEVSLSFPTRIFEYKCKSNEIREYTLRPEDVGLNRVHLADIQCSSAQDSAEIIYGILDGAIAGPKRHIVELNSAATLIAADKVSTWEEGISLAEESINSGKALKKLKDFVTITCTV